MTFEAGDDVKAIYLDGKKLKRSFVAFADDVLGVVHIKKFLDCSCGHCFDLVEYRGDVRIVMPTPLVFH